MVLTKVISNGIFHSFCKVKLTGIVTFFLEDNTACQPKISSDRKTIVLEKVTVSEQERIRGYHVWDPNECGQPVTSLVSPGLSIYIGREMLLEVRLKGRITFYLGGKYYQPETSPDGAEIIFSEVILTESQKEESLPIHQWNEYSAYHQRDESRHPITYLLSPEISISTGLHP